MMLGELGVIHISAGNLNAATPPLVEGLARTWSAGDEATLTRTLRGLAAVAAATGRPHASARLLGAADTIDPRTPFAGIAARRDRDIVARCLDRLDGALDATVLDQERRAGASLTVEQAVALAREAAKSVVGAARVDAIWETTQAPDPGPVPTPTAATCLAITPATTDARVLLTARERDVLALLCQHLTDHDIADRLFISPRTAEGHVAHIIAKLGVENRRDAAALAARMGLA